MGVFYRNTAASGKEIVSRFGKMLIRVLFEVYTLLKLLNYGAGDSLVGN